MHADGKSTLASVSKWNSVKVNSYREKQTDIDNLLLITGHFVMTMLSGILIKVHSLAFGRRLALAEFYYNRGLQRPYTGTYTIL